MEETKYRFKKYFFRRIILNLDNFLSINPLNRVPNVWFWITTSNDVVEENGPKSRGEEKN